MLYLNTSMNNIFQFAPHLTLTSVVFEYRNNMLFPTCYINLTLTSVVFEYIFHNDSCYFIYYLTLTSVVFELYYGDRIGYSEFI